MPKKVQKKANFSTIFIADMLPTIWFIPTDNLPKNKNKEE